MRTDYVLYVVAIIFFAITAISYFALTTETERNLSMVATVILGLVAIGIGYTQRPKGAFSSASKPPTLTVPEPSTVTQPPKIGETAKLKEAEAVVPIAPKITELTAVKGIKAKRAEQLKALGINSAEDLAKASPQELSAKLKIAQYFTERWVASAKELVEKS
ncbi:MAG: DUF4332 domain-containing protein [Candidatus Bathyarchaeia archaeon]